MMSKLFGVLGVCLVVGCAGTKKQAPVVAPAPTHAIQMNAPVIPDLRKGEEIEGTAWKLILPVDWKYETGKDDAGPELRHELLARSEGLYGTKHVFISLVSSKFANDPMDFINGTLQAAKNADNIRIFDTNMVQIGHFPGAVVGAARNMSVGIIGSIDLLTAGNGNAYALSCGGDIKALPQYVELCLDVIQSFEIK